MPGVRSTGTGYRPRTARAAALGAVVAALLLSGGCSTTPAGQDPRASGPGAGPSGPGSGTAGPAAAVDAGEPTVDGAPLVARVSLDRLMADVEALAASPRDVVQDHAAALAAADHVADGFAAAGLVPQRIDVTAAGVTLPVVWTEIRGARCAGTTLVLSGHYDTVPGSPGADDDASGVAAVLEAGRVLADRPLPASVVLAAVPFEELGEEYPGAAALARALLDDPGRRVAAMVSAEMLGYATTAPDSQGQPGDYLNLLGHRGAEQLVAQFTAAAGRWVPGFEIQGDTFDPDTPFIDRADNAAFHRLGVPSAFATDGADYRTPHYHTADDTPENISRAFFRDCVRSLVAWLVWAGSSGC